MIFSSDMRSFWLFGGPALQGSCKAGPERKGYSSTTMLSLKPKK
jgi:hypothetical protein